MAYTLTQVRILRAPPERVYRAFLEPAALAKWNPPDGFAAVVHELDARVGGRFRMSFVNCQRRLKSDPLSIGNVGVKLTHLVLSPRALLGREATQQRP